MELNFVIFGGWIFKAVWHGCYCCCLFIANYVQKCVEIVLYSAFEFWVNFMATVFNFILKYFCSYYTSKMSIKYTIFWIFTKNL